MKFNELNEYVEKYVNERRLQIRKLFVASAYQIHAGIVKKFYNVAPGSSEGLANRTGTASRSWKVSVKNTKDSVICNVYSAGVPYADFSKRTIIRPKKANGWLAIPVVAGLTDGGAARYPGGPRQAEQKLMSSGVKKPLAFIRKKNGSNNKAYIVAKKGVKGPGLNKKDRLLFALRKVVVKPARTKSLMPWVDSKFESMIQRISKASGVGSLS